MARQKITALLQGVLEGRIMKNEELQRFLAHFTRGRFGELIFLVKEGVLIISSYMGERPMRAMHGCHPHDPQSYAALFSNSPNVPEDLTPIPHIHRLVEKAPERPEIKVAAPSPRRWQPELSLLSSLMNNRPSRAEAMIHPPPRSCGDC